MYFDPIETHEDIHASVDYITKSHLRNVMQLAIFHTTSKQLYAINISKIQSFIIKEEVEMLQSPTKNPFVIGMVNIRGEVISVVDFDLWIGEPEESDEKRIIIVCNYNQKKIGILVRDILKIEEKQSTELNVPGNRDPKISYVTTIETEKGERSCIIFDAEKLLFDTKLGADTGRTTIYDVDTYEMRGKIASDKKVLIAEDSQIVIEKLHHFFTKTELDYEIYDNGELLMERLKQLDPKEIGLVITDIEMPVRNGYQVIKFLKAEAKYASIPILSLTSMTNRGVLDKVRQLGAIDLINKSDLDKLFNYLKTILHIERNA